MGLTKQIQIIRLIKTNFQILQHTENVFYIDQQKPTNVRFWCSFQEKIFMPDYNNRPDRSYSVNVKVHDKAKWSFQFSAVA